MNNNYDSQGAWKLDEVITWDSAIQHSDRNGSLATIVKVTPYGDTLDLFHVEFEDGFVTAAMSNDFLHVEPVTA